MARLLQPQMAQLVDTVSCSVETTPAYPPADMPSPKPFCCRGKCESGHGCTLGSLLRECQIQVLKPTFSTARYGTDGTPLRATWLGHACYLVELPCGLRILFDPVLTDRCSPVSWFGPKRFTKLPCEVHEIPIIDIVVISHNHYDHVRFPAPGGPATRLRQAC